MTEPSNLRDAAEVWREAAYEYGGESIPGEGEDRAAWVIELDRAAVEAATIAKVVAWLRSDKIVLSMDGSAEDVAASAIEAGEWKQ